MSHCEEVRGWWPSTARRRLRSPSAGRPAHARPLRGLCAGQAVRAALNRSGGHMKSAGRGTQAAGFGYTPGGPRRVPILVRPDDCATLAHRLSWRTDDPID